MERTLQLLLNKFEEIPASLRQTPDKNLPVSSFKVQLSSLYHHYYLDSFGCAPPDPDPAHFEAVRFLSNSSDFRFAGEGYGLGTLVRRNRSSELGNAFCRCFLHDHLNITYFARMEDVLDKGMCDPTSEFKIERIHTGDAPDYFCAQSVSRVCLAEAKGRYSPISFRKKEFNEWRDQFTRVAVRDKAGQQRSVKGYIVATRWATESDKPSIMSTLYAEDPATPGERGLEPAEGSPIGQMIVARHYGRIAEILDQPILAAALMSGSRIPDELQIVAVVWEVRTGPLAGRRFVGGFFAPRDDYFPAKQVDDKFIFGSGNPFRLGGSRGTFFGLEEAIFKQIVQLARRGRNFAGEVTRFERIQPFYSAFSLLRDGSVLAPLDFFAAVGTVEN